MDYKNKTFDTATVEAVQERETMVDIGFELPTLKELKAKWKCGNVAGGIRITGYKGSGTNEQIPDTTAEGTPIVAIGFSAGATFNPITTLHVGANVTTIEKKAFTDCDALTQLTFAGEITELGDSAFRGCTGLADADGFVVVAGVLRHYAGQGAISSCRRASAAWGHSPLKIARL